MTRSEVRRLRLVDLEHVRHQQHGQEWVPHWHDEWSFGAVVDGECRCLVGGRPFEARRGDLIAIPPGVVHTGALTAPSHRGDVWVTMLYVPAAWLAQAGLTPPTGSARLAAPALCEAARDLADAPAASTWLHRAVPALADALNTGASVDADADADADGGAAAAGAAVSHDAAPSAAVRRLLERVQAAVLADECTVAGVARHCGVSRERLHRVMTRWVGMTPAGYLRAVRLHRARHLLIDGQPVARVAVDCGFADQAHFTRWFRRSYGYTPGDLVQAAAGNQRPA